MRRGGLDCAVPGAGAARPEGLQSARSIAALKRRTAALGLLINLSPLPA
jgi:hypothetical protein